MQQLAEFFIIESMRTIFFKAFIFGFIPNNFIKFLLFKKHIKEINSIKLFIITVIANFLSSLCGYCLAFICIRISAKYVLHFFIPLLIAQEPSGSFVFYSLRENTLFYSILPLFMIFAFTIAWVIENLLIMDFFRNKMILEKINKVLLRANILSYLLLTTITIIIFLLS